MPDKAITILFSGGVNTDLPTYSLPIEAVTYINNFDYRNQSYVSSPAFDNAQNLIAQDGDYGHVSRLSDSQFMILGNEKTLLWNGTSVADTTGTQGLTGIDSINLHEWTSDTFGVVSFINHYHGYPQYYSTRTGGRYVDLPFNSEESWRDKNFHARAIRAHKNYLFALGMDEDSTEYPDVVRWSTTFDSGSFPVSWDETDPALQAGRVLIPEGQGGIIDGRTAGDNFLIYKTLGITNVVFTGGPFVFRFRPLSEVSGVLTNNCIAEVDSAHFVFGNDDILQITGGQIQSIAHNRIRKNIFADLNPSAYQTSHVLNFHRQSEIWFCYPTSAANFPDRAAVYNYRENAWTFRDYDLVFSTPGFVQDTRKTWSSLSSTTWANWREPWSGIDTALNEDIVGVRANQITRLAQPGIQLPGVLERTSMLINGLDGHVMAHLYPRIEAFGNPDIEITLGYQDGIGHPIVWKDPYRFVVGQERKVPVRISGALISWRITATNPLIVNGMELHLVGRGRR